MNGFWKLLTFLAPYAVWLVVCLLGWLLGLRPTFWEIFWYGLGGMLAVFTMILLDP